MNIIFLANNKSTFIKNFRDELKKKHILIEIFDPTDFCLYDHSGAILKKFNPPPHILDRIPKIGYFLKLIMLKRLYKHFAGKYDICHVHYYMQFYSGLNKYISRIGKKIIVSIWGSDFYQRSRIERRNQKKLYDLADIITFANYKTQDDFLAFYENKYSEKTRILLYGLKPLECIDSFRNNDIQEMKKLLSIPEHSIVVTTGSCSTENQRHREIFDSILNSAEEFPDHVFFVVPLTYGDPDYRIQIMSFLQKLHFPHKIFINYLSDEDVAKLRLVTDVFINVQKSDQLSGAMQEHLYAGSVVITGSWLPYEILYRKGVKLVRIDGLAELGNSLNKVVNHLDEFKIGTDINRSVIEETGLWSKNINHWIHLYHSI